MTELYLSQLNYGYANSGKTFEATSAIWDHERDEFIRKGYWISFGRESNPRITVPEITLEQASKGEYGMIRFVSPLLDTEEFSRKFGEFCRAVYLANRGKTKKVEAIIIDGMSEFDLMYETIHKEVYGTGNKYLKWDDLLDKCFSAFQILDPKELEAHVLVTARVTEVRKKEYDKAGNLIRKGDGDYIPTNYMPSMRGQFRVNMPHYFNLVTYYDTKTLMQNINGKNRRAPVHQAHMILTDDEYFISNRWEDKWIKAGKPDILNNPTFDEILTIVKGL